MTQMMHLECSEPFETLEMTSRAVKQETRRDSKAARMQSIYGHRPTVWTLSKLDQQGARLNTSELTMW